jgi:hypothetical protein
VRLRTCLNHRIFPLPLHNRHSRLSPAVPEFWHYEVGSALLKAKRSRRLSAAKIRTAMALLVPSARVFQATNAAMQD